MFDNSPDYLKHYSKEVVAYRSLKHRIFTYWLVDRLAATYAEYTIGGELVGLSSNTLAVLFRRVSAIDDRCRAAGINPDTLYHILSHRQGVRLLLAYERQGVDQDG